MSVNDGISLKAKWGLVDSIFRGSVSRAKLSSRTKLTGTTEYGQDHFPGRLNDILR